MVDDQVVSDLNNAAPHPNPSPTRLWVNSQTTAYPFPSSGSPTRENNHPYAVKTTSTGILTRSNSSGMTPNTSHSYLPLTSPCAPRYGSKPSGEHRTLRHTKSLSSNPLYVPPPLPFPPSRASSRSSSRSNSISDDEDRLWGLSDSYEGADAPYTRALRRETLPSLSTPTVSPSPQAKDGSELIKFLSLPDNPKYWTPTNLSLYLGSVLSVEHGGSFSSPVIRDIQTTIINEKLSGRAFLRLNEDDLDDMGITPSWRDKFIAQAHLLRQKVIKGRIYGFGRSGNRMSSTTLSPEHSDVDGHTSRSVSTRSDRMSRTGGDEEVGGSKSGWIGRAVFPTSVSAPTTVGDPYTSFSTPSRQSVHKLTSGGMRVRGMVASYERSVGSDSNASSSPSDGSELGDVPEHESEDRSFSGGENSGHSTAWDFSSEHSDVDSGKSAKEDDPIREVVATLGPRRDAIPVEEHHELLHSADVHTSAGDGPAVSIDSEAEESHHADLAGSALSLPHSSSPPGYYDDRSPPTVGDSDSELIERIGTAFSQKTEEQRPVTVVPTARLSLAVPDDPLHATAEPVVEEELSMEELLKRMGPEEEEEQAGGHPWLDDDIIGQTARRVAHHSSEKILRMGPSLRSSPSMAGSPAALSSLFAPPEPEVSFPAELAPVVDVVPAVQQAPATATRILVEQSVWTGTTEEGEIEVAQSAAAAAAADSLEFSSMLQVFRVRLEEVERRLDELETREAARAQEELHMRLELDKGNTGGGVFLGEVEEQAIFPAGPDHMAQEIVPTMHSSVVEASEDSKPITHPKSAINPRIWDSKNVVDDIPAGLADYVLGASLGVVVILVQFVFRRFVARRS